MGIYISSGKHTLKVDSKFLKKLKIEKTTIWLSNPTPGYIPRENYSSKRYMHPTFTAALLTAAKTWEQSARPLTEEWIKTGPIYAMEYYSAVKRNEVMPLAATWMDLTTPTLNDISLEKTYIIWCHLCVESKKLYQWTDLQNRNRLTDFENKFRITKEERLEGGMN